MFTVQMVMNLEIFPSDPQKGFDYLSEIRSPFPEGKTEVVQAVLNKL